jgi:hypothetical protein
VVEIRESRKLLQTPKFVWGFTLFGRYWTMLVINHTMQRRELGLWRMIKWRDMEGNDFVNGNLHPTICWRKEQTTIYIYICQYNQCYPVAYWRGGWGWTLPSKFRSFAKAEPNSQFRGIYILNNLIRIWVLFISKLSGTPDEEATAPRSPFSLPSILNWICWTPRKIPGITPPRKNSWLRHWC